MSVQKEAPRLLLAAALVIGLMYAAGSGLWKVFVALSLVLAVATVVRVMQANSRRVRTLALQDLQTLTPRELELHVARVIDALPGWRAETTRSRADQGVDVIATGPRGTKVAVQVK